MNDKEHIDKLRVALWHMVDCFKPLTMKPIGAPGSAARAKQDQQTAAHRKAKEALALLLHHRGGQHEV